MLKGFSPIGGYSSSGTWPKNHAEHGSLEPSTQKKSSKASKKTVIPNNTNSTETKVKEQRIRINNPSEDCTAQKVVFSELDIHELLKFRECSSCRNKANDELIKRLNEKNITLPHIGISRLVFDENSPGKMKPLLNQIIEFFGENNCSKLHHLDLTYAPNDFTLLKHFTGLRSLNLTATDFKDFWILDLMPDLKHLKTDENNA